MRDELPPWHHRYLGTDQPETRTHRAKKALRGTYHCSRVVENAYCRHLLRILVQLAYDDGLIKFVLARRRLMSAFGGKADVRELPSACPLIAKSGHSSIPF